MRGAQIHRHILELFSSSVRLKFGRRLGAIEPTSRVRRVQREHAIPFCQLASRVCSLTTDPLIRHFATAGLRRPIIAKGALRTNKILPRSVGPLGLIRTLLDLHDSAISQLETNPKKSI